MLQTTTLSENENTIRVYSREIAGLTDQLTACTRAQCHLAKPRLKRAPKTRAKIPYS